MKLALDTRTGRAIQALKRTCLTMGAPNMGAFVR